MITILASPTLQLIVVLIAQILSVDLIRSHVSLVFRTVVVHDFLKRGLHFHLLQGLPIEVYAGEELMILDVVPGLVTKPLSWLKFQERVDEVLQLLAEVGVLPVSVVLSRFH